MNRRAPAIPLAIVCSIVAGLVYLQENAADEQADKAPTEEASKEAAPSDAPKKDDAGPVAAELLPAPGDPSLAEAGKFHLMPDGSPVPGLPTSAPARVKLGVVLFKYQGAQGASDSTRSRESAQALAKEAHALAQKDFAAAVKKGDRGSNENIGWMPQRILERSVEYSIFTLAEGELAPAPVDTPRGFWVVKRLR